MFTLSCSSGLPKHRLTPDRQDHIDGARSSADGKLGSALKREKGDTSSIWETTTFTGLLTSCILQSMPTESAVESHQPSLSWATWLTRRRFLVSQIYETHNFKGLHALHKGKINHVSKLIPSISPNGFAYWSENYLPFFGYCIVLHLLCCFPPLFPAEHDKPAWYNMHVS